MMVLNKTALLFTQQITRTPWFTINSLFNIKYIVKGYPAKIDG